MEPFPEGMETIMFGETARTLKQKSVISVTDSKFIPLYLGMGCFWGAERLFWRLPGVFSTQVGFASGFTPNPTYEEVCSGNLTPCVFSCLRTVDTLININQSGWIPSEEVRGAGRTLLCQISQSSEIKKREGERKRRR